MYLAHLDFNNSNNASLSHVASKIKSHKLVIEIDSAWCLVLHALITTKFLILNTW